MKTIWLKSKCWIENKISRRLFGLDALTALLFMNIGKIYSDAIKENEVDCSCGAKFYPKVLGYSPNRKVQYCPFCGGKYR